MIDLHDLLMNLLLKMLHDQKRTTQHISTKKKEIIDLIKKKHRSFGAFLLLVSISRLIFFEIFFEIIKWSCFRFHDKIWNVHVHRLICENQSLIVRLCIRHISWKNLKFLIVDISFERCCVSNFFSCNSDQISLSCSNQMTSSFIIVRLNIKPETWIVCISLNIETQIPCNQSHKLNVICTSNWIQFQPCNRRVHSCRCCIECCLSCESSSKCLFGSSIWKWKSSHLIRCVWL